jgi:hypothetical protein
MKGAYRVQGKQAAAGSFRSISSSGLRDAARPTEVEWAVTAAAYGRLQPGMGLEAARDVLGLSTLEYVPSAPDQRWRLVLKDGQVRVTLEWGGAPVGLIHKASQGLGETPPAPATPALSGSG